MTVVTPAGYTNTTHESDVAEVAGSSQEVTVDFGCQSSGIYLPLTVRTLPQQDPGGGERKHTKKRGRPPAFAA